MTPKRRSLAFRLLCLSAAAATLPALVIALVLRSISSRSLEASIEQNQREIAQRLAESVNGEIRQAQAMLSFAARTPGVQSGGLVETQRALLNVMHSIPSVQEVMEVLDSGEERAKVTRRGTTGRLIRRTVNLQQRSVGAPFFSGNRLPTVLITEPIKLESGKLTGRSGALVAKISFSGLGELMQKAQVGQTGLAFIVDQRGMLLAHPEDERVRAHTTLAQNPVVQEWIQRPNAPTGLHQYADEHGSAVMGLGTPIPLLRSAVVVQQPKADVYAPLQRMQRSFIIWTTLSVGLFVIITVVIAWRIQQPLRQLQYAAERIAAGKMDVQLNIHTNDELEELAKAFSRMTDSLKQLETMRRDLINMLVHDLKSPLSSILTSMDYLLTGQAGPVSQEQRRFLAIGHRSGTEMLNLVQNLLDVARMEEGKLLLNREAFSVAEWAEEVLTTYRPIAEAGKKVLTLSVEENIPPLEADRSLLARVLGNLLSNALRHTPLGTGVVHIALKRRGDQLNVEVRDNGQGIPPEYLNRIFEKFVQIERRRAHLRTGTGLGLTFCKMVVDAHGGRIYVQSVASEGSTFTFLIPLATAVPAADKAPESAVLSS
jgi:signal transduction histidine kinase